MAADASLPTLEVQACECARLFRLGRDIEAGLKMSALWTDVVPLLNAQTPESAQRWHLLLTLMLARQEAQDWLGLADYLEYELVELLAEGGRESALRS
jgi:hypothetical protein